MGGCGSNPPRNPIHDALAQEPPRTSFGASVVFRFTNESGSALQIHRLPTLEEVDWQFKTPELRIKEVVGYARENDLIYLLTDDSELAALDLASGRTRIIDSAVARAVLGPDGDAYLVKENGAVGTVRQTRAVFWSDTLTQIPSRLWGAAGGRFLGLVEQGDKLDLLVLASGQTSVARNLPRSQMALASWGDVAVSAVDTGLILIDPRGRAADSFVRLDLPPGAVTISPAGHRIYAVVGGELTIINRFQGVILKVVPLPALTTDLRVDPLGRIMLVRSLDGQTIWIVDLITTTLVATVKGTWTDDLPAVAPDGTVLIRDGDDVVALSAEGYTEVGRIRDGAPDRWLPAQWEPRTPALALASDTATAADSIGQFFYVQVSSTHNNAWAEDLAGKLRAAGMKASVLTPEFLDEQYRVVLGPYLSRDEAENIGRKLGRSYWIFSRESEPLTP